MTQAEFDQFANRRLTDEDIGYLLGQIDKETDGCEAEALDTLISNEHYRRYQETKGFDRPCPLFKAIKK